jgi:hypothetical protein
VDQVEVVPPQTLLGARQEPRIRDMQAEMHLQALQLPSVPEEVEEEPDRLATTVLPMSEATEEQAYLQALMAFQRHALAAVEVAGQTVTPDLDLA